MNAPNEFEYIKENLKEIYENIKKAAEQSGRSASDITLVAASKTVDATRVNYALEAGLQYIGENRVQEFLEKQPQLNIDRARTHFIGHLQRNKVRQIVPYVGMIESVSSTRLAKEISVRALQNDMVMPVLLQVNIGNEENKQGFAGSEIEEELAKIAEFKGIKVHGIMSIPPFEQNPEDSRKHFAHMKTLQVDIKAKNMDNVNMDILSMGMSMDYFEAILEGTTHVRVGSSLFGKRKIVTGGQINE